MVRWIQIATFFAAAVLIFRAVWLRNALLYRLRERHPERWRALGSPTTWAAPARGKPLPGSSRAYRAYMARGDFNDLADPDFESMAVRLRVVDRWVVVVTLVLVVSTVAHETAESARQTRALPGAPPAPASQAAR